MTWSFAHTVKPAKSSRKPGLPLPAALPLLAAIFAAGCAGNAEGAVPEDISDTDQVAVAALRMDAFATPETVGGFCTEGAGVFLSAVDNTAELTLYVVAPATIATFGHPALYLTTQEGEHRATETVEFEDVTLEAGESRVLRKQTAGTLMEVYADFAGEDG